MRRERRRLKARHIWVALKVTVDKVEGETPCTACYKTWLGRPTRALMLSPACRCLLPFGALPETDSWLGCVV